MGRDEKLRHCLRPEELPESALDGGTAETRARISTAQKAIVAAVDAEIVRLGFEHDGGAEESAAADRCANVLAARLPGEGQGGGRAGGAALHGGLPQDRLARADALNSAGARAEPDDPGAGAGSQKEGLPHRRAPGGG